MDRNEAVRELFIEELAEVRGGVEVQGAFQPLTQTKWFSENIEVYSTMACGEEGPC